MSFETADDARRVSRLSRTEYDRLLAYLDRLEPAGWTEPSACADWQVYQVVSHLGSQPRITGAAILAGLRGEPPMTDEERRAIWDHFDGLRPDEVLPEFRRANAEYYRLLASLTDDELGRTIPWIAGPAPLANVLANRLNEQVLHAWDIYWARDKEATLSSAAVEDLLDLNLTPARLGGLVKPDRAERLVDKTIEFHLRDPERWATLDLRGDAVAGSWDRADEPEVTVELPAEAFLRLIWGRYDVADGVLSGQLILSQPELARDLRALFPGR
jgi:uncharacterized protein (TIGR03083 family)